MIRHSKIKKMVPILLMSVFLAAALFFFSGAAATAQDSDFQENESQIIDALTRKPTRYRSFNPNANVRSIVVVEKKATAPQGTGYETKTIQVVDNQDIPTARLKIEFDYNSSALRRSSLPLLQELGRALTSRELETANMLVAGHTDSDGTERYNLRLSLDRAESVRNYLVRHFNIPYSRLKIRGYGETMPIRPNESPADKQANRRVEVQMN